MSLVLEKTPETRNIVVITDDTKKPIAVFLRTEFLSKYNQCDEIVMMDEFLFPKWGYELLGIVQRGKNALSAIHKSAQQSEFSNWRCRANNISAITLKDILDEFEIAKKYKRQLFVRVYSA